MNSVFMRVVFIPRRVLGLMKTGTGSAIRCIYASAQALLVAVPVPLFISPDEYCQSKFHRNVP